MPAVTEGDESVIGYLRYCREQGMSYKAEITDMLQGGLYTYKDKVQAIMQVRGMAWRGRGSYVWMHASCIARVGRMRPHVVMSRELPPPPHVHLSIYHPPMHTSNIPF